MLVTVTVAVKLPAAFGVKLTATGTLCPAATVMGTLGETRAKYLLEMETLLTVTDSGPEFVAFKERVFVPPACTLPNCRMAALSERVVDCCC